MSAIADALEQAHFLETLESGPFYADEEPRAELLTRIDLAWCAVTRARDEERESETSITMPRISLRSPG